MRILVIDGQGGGLGRSIVEQIKQVKQIKECEIIAAGTNSAAALSMLKAGADIAVSGENAAVYNSKKADIIVGALGICFANSMHGEISPAIAQAVCESEAVKILIPISKCNINIMGVTDKSMSQYISEAVEKIKEFALI